MMILQLLCCLQVAVSHCILSSLTNRHFFHLSGTFSCCHILLNNLVCFFTATSYSFLYKSSEISSISSAFPLFVLFSTCVISAFPCISVVSISLILLAFTSCSLIGFVWVSLVSTVSKGLTIFQVEHLFLSVFHNSCSWLNCCNVSVLLVFDFSGSLVQFSGSSFCSWRFFLVNP